MGTTGRRCRSSRRHQHGLAGRVRGGLPVRRAPVPRAPTCRRSDCTRPRTGTGTPSPATATAGPRSRTTSPGTPAPPSRCRSPTSPTRARGRRRRSSTTPAVVVDGVVVDADGFEGATSAVGRRRAARRQPAATDRTGRSAARCCARTAARRPTRPCCWASASSSCRHRRPGLSWSAWPSPASSSETRHVRDQTVVLRRRHPGFVSPMARADGGIGDAKIDERDVGQRSTGARSLRLMTSRYQWGRCRVACAPWSRTRRGARRRATTGCGSCPMGRSWSCGAAGSPSVLTFDG